MPALFEIDGNPIGLIVRGGPLAMTLDEVSAPDAGDDRPEIEMVEFGASVVPDTSEDPAPATEDDMPVVPRAKLCREVDRHAARPRHPHPPDQIRRGQAKSKLLLRLAQDAGLCLFRPLAPAAGKVQMPGPENVRPVVPPDHQKLPADQQDQLGASEAGVVCLHAAAYTGPAHRLRRLPDPPWTPSAATA